MCSLLVGMFLLGGPTTAGATTYAVAFFNGSIGIGGEITTDGTLGIINAFNIIDWNLIGATQNSLQGNNLMNSTSRPLQPI
jgi:hypothetical protein